MSKARAKRGQGVGKPFSKQLRISLFLLEREGERTKERRVARGQGVGKAWARRWHGAGKAWGNPFSKQLSLSLFLFRERRRKEK